MRKRQDSGKEEGWRCGDGGGGGAGQEALHTGQRPLQEGPGHGPPPAPLPLWSLQLPDGMGRGGLLETDQWA